MTHSRLGIFMFSLCGHLQSLSLWRPPRRRLLTLSGSVYGPFLCRKNVQRGPRGQGLGACWEDMRRAELSSLRRRRCWWGIRGTCLSGWMHHVC